MFKAYLGRNQAISSCQGTLRQAEMRNRISISYNLTALDAMLTLFVNDQSCNAVLTLAVVLPLTRKCHKFVSFIIRRAPPHLQACCSWFSQAVYQIHGSSGSLVVYDHLGTEQVAGIVSSGSWTLEFPVIPVHCSTAIAPWGPSRYGTLQADCHPYLAPPHRCVR